MTAEAVAKFRLSVWREYTPIRSLVVHDQHQPPRLLSASEDLQEEIYRWSLPDDPFAGVSQEECRASLKAKLVDEFNPTRPPKNRRVQALDAFLEEAEGLLSDGRSEWTVSQSGERSDGSPIYVNALLSLTIHLKWLRNMFVEQPGISLSIR